MQRFTLLLADLSATAQTQTTNLNLVDEYYVYSQQNGGGIVDEFNVKTYLDDPDNSNISENFFRFLTGNTNVTQFREIFFDNKKLANIFNKFYNNSVVTNNATPTSVINNELTGTTNIIGSYYYQNWDGHSSGYFPYMNGIPSSINNSSLHTVSRNQLITVTDEDSYYINVNIDLSHRLINQIDFSEYSQDFYQRETILRKARWGAELTNPMLEFIKQVRPDVTSTMSNNYSQIRRWYDIYGRFELPWGTITMEQIAASDLTPITRRVVNCMYDLTPKMIKFIRNNRADVNRIFGSDIEIKRWFEMWGKNSLPWRNITFDSILSSDTEYVNNPIKQSFVDINIDDDFGKSWEHIYRSPDQVTPRGIGLNLSYYTGVTVDFLPPINSLNNPNRVVTAGVSLDSWGRTFTDNFILRFTGYFYAEVPAIYTFNLGSDDGSSLHVGDFLCIKNDGLHGVRNVEGSIGLMPGLHKIDVRYFEKNGPEALNFSYRINDGLENTNATFYY